MTRSLITLLLAAVLAAPASAAPVPLGGSPLNVIVGDQGQLQAFRIDRTNPADPPGIFYQPQLQLGDAGFFLAFPATPAVWGFTGTAGPHLTNQYTAVSQGGVTGSGSAADPLRQMTVYSAAAGAVTVTQTTTYVNGSQEFRVHWDVHNNGTTVAFKAIAAADFFFEGDDAGTGIFTQGPPRFIGGTNVDSGSSGGFVEVSPAWSHYQALDFPTVWSKVRAAADTTGQVWDDTVLDQPADNAGGVEWDDQTLANGATSSYELVIRSAVPSALQLNPTNAGSRQGVPINITATATDSNGQPYAGKILRYTIAGPNATTGGATLGATGSAVVTDPGAHAGTDNVTVFVDFNNDGVRQPVEPQATALATFVDSVPPACTIKVSGTLPGGGGSGKPLVINVSCGEGATVSVATTLQPPTSGRRAASAAKAKKKKKPKKVKLKTRTVSVAAGKPTAVKLKIPKSVARRYAGKTLTATITVTAKDTAGNVKKTTLKRKVKLAKIKKKKAKRH
ncbi:MAG TPA: hypothetical protein VH834_11535 [Solirubrobacteraceae bacterium]